MDLTSLKSMFAEKEAAAAALQAQADEAAAAAADLQSKIDKLSGWRKGLGGILGLDWSNANRWGGEAVTASSDGGNVRSLGIAADISGHLLKDTEKTFWHNNLKVLGAYKDLDLAQETDIVRGDGVLDLQSRVADLFNVSSLGGYKLTDKLALSAIGELNTTLLDGKFFDPATIDLGLGVTWLPIENMTVSIFPLGYNIVARRTGDVDGTAAFGAKYKVVYFRDFDIGGKAFHWDTNLTGFFPYGQDPIGVGDGFREAGTGNTYWQWLNNVTFEVLNGIGVGFGFGFRQADFQAFDANGDTEIQNYTTLGLSYSL